MDGELAKTERQLNLLIKEIETAAKRAGILRRDVEIDGPQAILLLRDMSDALVMWRPHGQS